MKGKYTPRVGTTFGSRDELEQKLLESGWNFEGASTSLDRGNIVGQDIGVEKGNLWVVISMKPFGDGVKVTKVKRLRQIGKEWK